MDYPDSTDMIRFFTTDEHGLTRMLAEKAKAPIVLKLYFLSVFISVHLWLIFFITALPICIINGK